jgi:hypothetical protein
VYWLLTERDDVKLHAVTHTDVARQVLGLHGATEGGVFSTTERSVPLPASDWIDVAVIADELEKRIGDFAHQPTVRIRDSANGSVPGASDGDAVDGAVHDGAIYLFRDQLPSLGDVQRTLFHELFHYGFNSCQPHHMK